MVKRGHGRSWASWRWVFLFLRSALGATPHVDPSDGHGGPVARAFTILGTVLRTSERNRPISGIAAAAIMASVARNSSERLGKDESLPGWRIRVTPPAVLRVPIACA
jgi:hypothetical protein